MKDSPEHCIYCEGRMTADKDQKHKYETSYTCEKCGCHCISKESVEGKHFHSRHTWTMGVKK